MSKDIKKYNSSHMIGQVEYMQVGMLVTEPLPVVYPEELVGEKKVKGHQKTDNLQEIKKK